MNWYQLGPTGPSLEPNGPSWFLTGPSWFPTGPSLEPTGPHWRPTGTRWGPSGTRWRPVGTRWRPSGTRWGPSETRQGQFGTPCGRQLGQSGLHLVPILGHLGPTTSFINFIEEVVLGPHVHASAGSQTGRHVFGGDLYTSKRDTWVKAIQDPCMYG